MRSLPELKKSVSLLKFNKKSREKEYQKYSKWNALDESSPHYSVNCPSCGAHSTEHCFPHCISNPDVRAGKWDKPSLAKSQGYDWDNDIAPHFTDVNKLRSKHIPSHVRSHLKPFLNSLAGHHGDHPDTVFVDHDKHKTSIEIGTLDRPDPLTTTAHIDHKSGNVKIHRSSQPKNAAVSGHISKFANEIPK